MAHPYRVLPAVEAAPPRRHRSFNVLLLASASAFALLTATAAHAGTLSQAAASHSLTASATATAAAAQQQATTLAQQSQQTLAQAAKAIQQMQQAQAAARALAATAGTNGVTDGLSAGGLVVDPRIGTDSNLWQNISAPNQTTSNGQTTVTLTQSSQRAIATWQQFNVGRNTTLYFDQSAGTTSNGNAWVVLNRIDATGVPSQILGQIKAEGTVLIINPNGIIFTGTSQINVHSLIASAMDINSYGGSGTANVGVFSTSGAQYTQFSVNGASFLAPVNEDNANTAFRNNGLFVNGAIGSTPGTLVLSAGTGAGTNPGVVVQPGAIISTVGNVSGFDNGGYVALVGPQVTNAGNITTSAGQITLAAGGSVLLTEPAAGSTTTSFSVANALPVGVSLAYSPAVAGEAGVLNDTTGILMANRGNITLVGDEVGQLGYAGATTSITRAGSITMTATGTPTTANPNSGLVLFGPGSTTTILPEENGETIPSDAASLQNFQAPHIDVATTNFDMQPGSMILAPGAAMNVTTYIPPGSSGQFPFGRVLLEAGSEINLAGITGVTRSVADYLYTFKVTANDAADSPLARNLIGQTVTIDLSLTGTRADGESWVGSPLFASSGASHLANITQKIDQLLTKGGSLTIGSSAFEDVIMASGSTVNVSGGWIRFTGATINTTKVIGSDGRIYDIGSANPFIANTIASGFTVVHRRWGVTETYTNPLLSRGYYKAGYIDGVSAGSIAAAAVNPVLEGSIVADIVTGSRQVALAQAGTGTNGTQATPDQLPRGASLTVNVKQGGDIDATSAVVLDSFAPDVLGTEFTIASALNLPQGTITYSTAALSAESFGAITISGARTLTMSEGAHLSVRDGGSVTLNNAISIDGTITAHGGKIKIAGFTPTATSTNGNPNAYVFPDEYRDLVIGAHAVLDVSGLWVNDSGAGGAAFEGAAFVNGGSVSLTTYGLSHAVGTTSVNGVTTVDAADGTASIVLSAGSLIDVTSGGYIGASGRLKVGSDGLPAGNGGSLSLLTYSQFANTGWTSATVADNLYDRDSNQYAPGAANAATVVMNGTIRAGGLSTGGSFTLQAPAITIDGAATAIASATSGNNAGTVTLPTSFFQGGFSSYNLTSTYGSVTVTPGTVVRVAQQNFRIGSQLPVTGTPLASFASLGQAPDGMRHAASFAATEIPFNFGVAGDPASTGGIVLGNGAAIDTDPGASVSLTSGRSLDVFGRIIDHAGAVMLAGALDTWIGTGAVIDVSGTFVANPLVTNDQTGTELAGGSIAFGLNNPVANYAYSGNGAVIIQSGALLDLAGGEATVLLPTAVGKTGTQTIWSGGGTLIFHQSSHLYLGGTINAAGGAPDAAGGTIEVGYANDTFGSIVVAQGGDPSAPFNGASAPVTASQLASLLARAPASSGAAYVTADTLSHSGFSTVVLAGNNVTFPGSVSLSGIGELDLAGSLVLPTTGGATVNLAANYIRLLGYTSIAPTLGDGTLTIAAADQIDIEGAVSVSGASNVNLTSGGDIRLIWTDGSALAAPLVTLAPQADGSVKATPLLSATSLNVADSLTLTAREVYAATNTQGVLLSLGLGATSTIMIASNGLTPVTPLSAGGSLLLAAPTIVQNGALYAPLGTIQLGVSASEPVPAGITLVGTAPTTTSVTLNPGSLTSVSLAGLDVPYSYTVNGDWQISTLPEKQVILAGTNVTTKTGAVLDLSGGGDLYATEFVAGTGGSRNGLTTGSQTVYALVPDYHSTIAAPFPTDGYSLASWGSGGADAASAFALQAGTTVRLPGGNGIAAGTYTLMPAMFATLPGAYRVVVAASNVNPRLPFSSVAADGTVYTTGIFGNAITGSRASQTALLEIQSNAVWTRYSEIDISSANRAFTQTAIDNGIVTPRLPIDAGHLILAATANLDVNATNLFAVGAATDTSGAILTGRGGLADVTGSNLVIVAADQAASYAANSAYDGATFLDADQLSHLGVASLLIGGVRTSTSSGVALTPTAISLTVATDVAHPLTAPDLILATGASITSTTTTTQLSAATGAQTVTIAAGLSGVNVGTGIILYNPTNPLSWVQGTVTSYDPTTGGLTLSGAIANGSGPFSNAKVLIATPSLGTGLVVADGSVVKAVGAVPAGTSQNIAIGANPVVTATDSSGNVTQYIPGVSGDGALLRVSNSGDVTITRAFVPGIYGNAVLPVAFGPVSSAPNGRLDVGAASLQGNAIAFDSSGTAILSPDATLSAAHFTLASNLINLGGNNPSGLTLTADTLARFAGAQSITLHSYSAFNLYGNQSFGSASAPLGSLTFDGSGLYSDGGTFTVNAANVAFVDSQSSPSIGGANTGGSGGGLNVTASGTITFGAGAETWSGLAQVAMTADAQILFTGSGSVTAGSANTVFTTPAIVADTGAAQAFTTTGALVLAPTGGDLPTLASTMLGGKIALTGGAVAVSNAILAPGGAITLEATSGDVTLASGALVAARGSRISLFGLLNEDVAAGTVKLTADAGNVTLAAGSIVDVSAAGTGYAGTVSISAANGTAALGGTLLGSAAYKDLGGTFVLNADRLAGSLPLGNSFSGVYAVNLGHGDIRIDAGQSILAGIIQLVANDGSVTINGTLDASGPSGGTIALYGAGTTIGTGATATVTGGVNIGATARLMARYQADDPGDPAYAKGNSTLVQNGGTITLGTSGIGSTTVLDPQQGYEIVLPGQSGTINVASGAQFDVSGGPGGANISNTGGAVYLRAPIVENADGSNRSVNVNFNGTLITNADSNGRPSGKGLVLQPYATWSTADQQSDTTKYFDGIVDPAGWYSSGGTLVAGTFKDAIGNVIANWSGSSAPSFSNVTSQILTSATGTLAVMVSPGLDLAPGDVIELADVYSRRINGTVLSYDSATGALVVNASNAYPAGASQQNWTVYYSKTGAFLPETSWTGIYGGMEQTDTDGSIYFYGGFTLPAEYAPRTIATGQSLVLKMQTYDGQIVTYNGTVKTYILKGNGDVDFEWYAPGLVADIAANKYYLNSYTPGLLPTLVYWSIGATTPVGTASTQTLTIGTGTRVMTVATAQSYTAGEAITLIDSNAPGNSMTGTITSYSPTTGALVLNVTSDTGDGSAVSGNWNFGVSLPQSVINSFLANDYFTPTAVNTAHQTFYGFVNGNAAAAVPGTLMSFIQNPFAGNDAAALAGFAGGKIQIGQSGTPVSLGAAGALHISPEVDLVNPSSSVNGGAISVVTSWNLGAGVAGSDGNPASLYFRYDGWAPTIVMRAAGNVNLDASITDGFFQKDPTVGGYSPPPAGPTYNTVVASQLYINQFNTSTGDLRTFNFGGLTPDYTALALKPPATFSGGANQYYVAYNQYLNAWQNFYSNGISYNSGWFTNSGGWPVSADVISTLAAANAAYSSTNLAAYGNYINLYDTYMVAVRQWSDASWNPLSAIPSAPLPPPAISALVPPTIQPLVNNGPAPIRTVTDQSPIAGMGLVAEPSSTSYKIVAGAQFALSGGAASVNPDTVVPTGSSGDITLDGHISYYNNAFPAVVWNGSGSTTYNPRIDIPTIIRTGTGSIDMVAAGDIKWLDVLSPAAVYTAGTVVTNAADFTAPTLPSVASGPNGLVSTPTWATGGGAIILSAGRDIIGIETPVDSELLTTLSGVADAQTLGSNSPGMGQFWSAWYVTLGKPTGEATTPFNSAEGGVQNGSYINYATFSQGVGALGGGNVTVNAGRNAYDLSVSLPETIQVSGGRFAGDSAPTAHDYGGGDLAGTVGGNLYSSTFYVGRGTGVIRVTGSVLADPANPVTGLATGTYASQWSGQSGGGFIGTVPIASTGIGQFTAAPLLLAEQDGYITVQAGGSISLGGVFEPTRVPVNNYPYFPATYMPAGYGSGFDSYGANSGLTLIAAGGNVTLLDALPSTLYRLGTQPSASTSPDNILPPTLDVFSVAGGITIGNAADGFMPYTLYPSATGNLILAAGRDISTAYGQNSGGLTLFLDTIQMVDPASSSGMNFFSALGAPTPSTLSVAPHADDPNPALILAGQDIVGSFKLTKAATMEAGRDILDTGFIGQNNNASEVTSIIAGRDIRSTNVIDGVTYIPGSGTASPGSANAPAGNTVLELYGPGQFMVSAGRNIGSFLAYPYSDVGGGVFAVGDGSNVGSVQVAPGVVVSGVVPYLPSAGANITMLFGVGPGMDVAAAIAKYVDPATSHADGINYLPSIASQLGVSQDRAWAAFQALSPVRQTLMVERAFLDFLTRVNADYGNAASPYYQQYARAYQSIATLFPASAGYTDNNTGGGNGASVLVHTGDLKMARSRIETQTGGDINILGPGGGITVGANQADTIPPNQEGILTLQGGSIRTYTDGSVQIYQSRIFTEQGGNVELFSANGDLNAGKGPKSKSAYPPLLLVCDTDGYCRVSPAGLVTGAGIGALLTLPGQDPDLSNATLTAPHGTVDAGAAGIRVSGNLSIIALQVLNAFNIQVGGTAIGLPTAPTVNLGALTDASSTSGAASAAADQAARNARQAGSRSNDLPSIITFEVVGYGGVSADNAQEQQRRQEEERRRRELYKIKNDQSYDQNSHLHVVGLGSLGADAQKSLTREEQNAANGRTGQ